MQLKLSDQDCYGIQLYLVLILFLISRKTLTSLVNIYTVRLEYYLLKQMYTNVCLLPRCKRFLSNKYFQKDTLAEFLSYFLVQKPKHACCVTSQTFLMVYVTKPFALLAP